MKLPGGPANLSGGRAGELFKIVRNPAESKHVDALATIIATLEHRQLAAVQEQHAALGIDTVEVRRSKDERKEQLLELVDALANGSVTDYWFREVAAEHIENPEDAKPYAGLSDEEWQEQIETWAEAYRERGASEETGDRELARRHVYSRFGVSIEVFEREVVDFQEGDVLQQLLASNFEAVEQGIRATTREIEQMNGNGGETDE